MENDGKVESQRLYKLFDEVMLDLNPEMNDLMKQFTSLLENVFFAAYELGYKDGLDDKS